MHNKWIERARITNEKGLCFISLVPIVDFNEATLVEHSDAGWVWVFKKWIK